MRRATAWWLAGAVTSFVLFGMSLLVAWLVAFANAMDTLPTYPSTVTGTVIDLVTEEYPDSGYYPCGPVYEFTLGGQTYQAASPNVDDGWCDLTIGDPIKLTYDPRNPAKYNAPAHGTNPVLVVLGFSGALLAGSVLCGVMAVRARATGSGRRQADQEP